MKVKVEALSMMEVTLEACNMGSGQAHLPFFDFKYLNKRIIVQVVLIFFTHVYLLLNLFGHFSMQPMLPSTSSLVGQDLLYWARTSQHLKQDQCDKHISFLGLFLQGPIVHQLLFIQEQPKRILESWIDQNVRDMSIHPRNAFDKLV